MPRTKDTVAARNLNFPSETFTIPSKITIKVRGAEDNLIAAEVIPIRGNCVRIIESLISIVREVAVCRTCQLRTLKLLQTSTLSCATNLMFHCENCFASWSFWGVSGHFRSKIEVGDIKITRRNEMMYSCVLAGRMIDIGETSLQFYHAALNIPPPPSGSSVQLIQKDLLISSEFLDNKCMNSAMNICLMRCALDCQLLSPLYTKERRRRLRNSTSCQSYSLPPRGKRR